MADSRAQGTVEAWIVNDLPGSVLPQIPISVTIAARLRASRLCVPMVLRVPS
jgi:hypothetical protein